MSRSREITVEIADTFMRRLRGWMFRDSPRELVAMWFPHTKAVHTWFMRFPIDIVYLDRVGRVCHVREHVPPWRVPAPVRGADAVLELPAGAAQALGLQTDSFVVLQRDPIDRSSGSVRALETRLEVS